MIMNTVIWILQGIIAMMMAMAALMKLTNSKDELKKNGKGGMDWVDDVSGSNVKMIGILEVLAAFGLVLPQLLGILPWLTPLAAVGIVFTMIGALTLHLRRGDGAQALMTNIFILSMAAFVAYGRFVIVPA